MRYLPLAEADRQAMLRAIGANSVEDLFVDESAREQGVAKALFGRLAKEAKARGCARIDWAVLDWNTEAMAFYEKLGGQRQTGWQPWRLHGPAFDAMAAEDG